MVYMGFPDMEEKTLSFTLLKMSMNCFLTRLNDESIAFRQYMLLEWALLLGIQHQN